MALSSRLFGIGFSCLTGTAVDDVSFRLMSYDILHLAGVSDYGYWHLSWRRGRKKKEPQKESDILNFVSLSSSIWEQDHSNAIPRSSLRALCSSWPFMRKLLHVELNLLQLSP